MKKKLDYRLIIISILIIIVGVMVYFYYQEDDSNYVDDNYWEYNETSDIENNESNNTNTISFSTTSQVLSALNEEIPLRAGYYFKKMLVTDNVVIKKGTKIIQYTNGQYLSAPYDLIITEYDLPESNKICNNSHKIKVSAYNVLSTQFRVSESKMDSIYIGKPVKIKVPALNNREIEGIITDISNTATNGRFIVTAEFDNDGDIKLGMTINISV